MKQKISYLLLGLLWVTLASAQSKEVQAKAAFLKAQELYGNAEYTEAIEKLKQTQTYLNGSNPRVDYLLTICAMESGDVITARKALKSYFDTAAESDPNYMAMLGIVSTLEELEKATKIQNEKVAAASQQQKQEETTWTETQKMNTENAYMDYLRVYPKGKYANSAKEKLGSMKSYDGQVVVRSKDLRARLDDGEYTYIIGSPQYALTSGEINLTFERISRVRGSIVPAKISINGVHVASLGNGKSVSFNMPAGKLVISLTTGDWEKYNRVLIYPARRSEKFIIDLQAWLPKDYAQSLQHEVTYTFEEESEESADPVKLRDQ